MRKENMMRRAAALMAAALILGGCGSASSSAPARQAAPAENAAEAAAEEKAQDAAAAAEEKTEAAAEAAAEESADPAAKEKMESAAEEKTEAVEKAAADSEKTFAEKVVGRYTCADGDSEVYVLELMNVHGNLYAKAGIAMADDSEGADSAAGAGGAAQASFPETYSFWAMELIPKDAGALLRTDTEEAEVGILSFSIMSNMSKYWSSPEKAILRLTDDGVVIASAEQGAGGEEVFREYKRWPDASAAVVDPGIVSVNTDTPGLDGLDGTEIPDELYGLWKEKDSGSPYVLEFLRTESGKEKNRGILRIWRKKPGAEVYLSDEAFLCTPQEKADGAQDPKDGKAGVLHASGTVLGNGDMPTMWEDCFVLKDGILTFPAKSGGAGFYESPFSGGQDTVFERAEETDIPLSQLAEADDVSAIRHEGKAETPAGARAVIPQFLASEDVENNGGNFLRVGDLVFFRDVREGLDGVTALWGDFLNVPDLSEDSKVMYYDRRTGETGTAFEDGGYGALWYLDGRFYSAAPGKNADENYSGQSLHRCWPDGSGMDDISEGNYASVTGASEKNDYLSIHQYVSGQEQYLVYDGSVYPVQLIEPENDEYFVYAGFAGEDLILVSRTGDRYPVSEIDLETGEKIRLGELPYNEAQDYAGAEIIQLYQEEDDIYLGVGWYAGTGHFLNGYYIVKMKARTENSVEEVPAELPESEGDPDRPWFFLNAAGEVLFTKYDPAGEVALSETDCGDLLYVDSPFGVSILEKDFIRESEARSSEAETVRILQDAEFVDGAAWIITADASRAPEEDIGWRSAYAAKGMTWQRIQVYNISVSADENFPIETILDSKTKP